MKWSGFATMLKRRSMRLGSNLLAEGFADELGPRLTIPQPNLYCGQSYARVLRMRPNPVGCFIIVRFSSFLKSYIRGSFHLGMLTFLTTLARSI